MLFESLSIDVRHIQYTIIYFAAEQLERGVRIIRDSKDQIFANSQLPPTIFV